MVFRKGEGVIGWVVDYGRPVVIRDTENDSRFVPGKNQGFGIRSIAAVPIQVGDKVIGVLSVSSPRPGIFTIEDLAMVQLLANCSVPVIEKARLEKLSPFDDLTLAYKEIQLMPRLEAHLDVSVRTDEALSLMVLSLDRLDAVYKQHGFEVGNKVLRRFADRVRELSHFTHWMHRRGADSFAVIMPDTDPAMARKQAEVVASHLDAHPLIVTRELMVELKASIGVATWSEDESAEDLFFRSEGAVLEARKQGGNRVVVSEPDQ
jgi:diguanylate cyclase (GGDEF)-like protein